MPAYPLDITNKACFAEYNFEKMRYSRLCGCYVVVLLNIHFKSTTNARWLIVIKF